LYPLIVEKGDSKILFKKSNKNYMVQFCLWYTNIYNNIMYGVMTGHLSFIFLPSSIPNTQLLVYVYAKQ
jgi:hypothetical protein